MYPTITSDTQILLGQAAKACGYKVTFKKGVCKGGAFVGCFLDDMPWRPDADDGDSARLAAKLGICICWHWLPNGMQSFSVSAKDYPTVTVLPQGGSTLEEKLALMRKEVLWCAAAVVAENEDDSHGS